MRIRPAFPFALALLASCGGGAREEVQIGPPPAPQTQGVLSGPLCNGDRCTCRDVSAAADGGAGVPGDAAHKRFEVRLGPSPQQLWAVIGKTILYKSDERSEACFYVDLPSGDTPVELRASDPHGVSAQWSIHEYGVQTKSWYDTFHFACGAPGVCSFDELEDQKPRYAAYKHGVEDMCGSVKIRGLTWDTGRSPDQLYPAELDVHLALSVYRRVPTQAHGDPTCGHGPPPPAAK